MPRSPRSLRSIRSFSEHELQGDTAKLGHDGRNAVDVVVQICEPLAACCGENQVVVVCIRHVRRISIVEFVVSPPECIARREALVVGRGGGMLVSVASISFVSIVVSTEISPLAVVNVKRPSPSRSERRLRPARPRRRRGPAWCGAGLRPPAHADHRLHVLGCRRGSVAWAGAAGGSRPVALLERLTIGNPQGYSTGDHNPRIFRRPPTHRRADPASHQCL
jgi:hypothetical protein